MSKSSFPTFEQAMAEADKPSLGVSMGRGNRVDHGARLAAIESDAKKMTGQTPGEVNGTTQESTPGTDRADGGGSARAEAIRTRGNPRAG